MVGLSSVSGLWHFSPTWWIYNCLKTTSSLQSLIRILKDPLNVSKISFFSHQLPRPHHFSSYFSITYLFENHLLSQTQHIYHLIYMFYNTQSAYSRCAIIDFHTSTFIVKMYIICTWPLPVNIITYQQFSINLLISLFNVLTSSSYELMGLLSPF